MPNDFAPLKEYFDGVNDRLDALRAQPEGFRIDRSPIQPRSRAHVAMSIHRGFRVIESEGLRVLMDGLEWDTARALVDAWNTAATSEVA